MKVDLPKYKYDFKTRLLAANLFSGSNLRTDRLDWGKENKKKILEEYKEFVDKIIDSSHQKKMKKDELSPELKKWFSENQRIYLSLAK